MNDLIMDQRIDGSLGSAISVIVISGGKSQHIDLAIQSILDQDYHGLIKILLVNDNHQKIPAIVTKIPQRDNVEFETHSILSGTENDGTPTVERVSRLRNIALKLISSELVAFIDDDNYWAKDHLSSLYKVLNEEKVECAHSWRKIISTTGTPRILKLFPWAEKGSERERYLFKAYSKAGVFSSSSSIVKDVCSLPIGDEDLGMVDMGEWLFRRTTIEAIGFETNYSDDDLTNRVGEDDKLLAAIKEYCISVSCTFHATLFYRLGGFSNKHEG